MTMTIGFATAPTISLFSRIRPVLKWSLLSLLMMAGAASAQTFTVNTVADGVDVNLGDGVCQAASGLCTLRAAIQESNANGSSDTITFSGPGEYILNIPNDPPPAGSQIPGEDAAAKGDLDINGSLTITGLGQSQTIINGNRQDRVFHILGASSVTMRDLTIKGGRAVNSVGGGVFVASGTLTLENVTVQDNSAENPAGVTNGGNGGGIFTTTASTLNVLASTISGNVSDTFNKGIGGGGIFNAGALRIENSTITGNTARNSPSAGGGGLQNQGGTGQDPNVARVTIIDSTFTNNSAVVGGGIRNLFGSVNIEGGTIQGNNATLLDASGQVIGGSGGGIENSGGGMIIGHVTIRDNTASNTGGGIANFDSLNISHSLIYHNSVSTSGVGQGGGLYNSGQGSMALLNTTVTDNTALEGGGIYNHRAIDLVNNTIYKNTSTRPNTASEIVACGTKDESNGLTCANDSGQVKTGIVNTIVGNDSGGAVAACGGEASLITSKGFNIDLGNSCGFTNTADLSNINPVDLFTTGVLEPNSGGTLSFAIRPDSVAVDRGGSKDCPVIDQRDFRRDTAKCDIGAYEISSDNTKLELVDLMVSVTSNAGTQGGSGQLTFTITVKNKGPKAATNIILTGKLPPWGMPDANAVTTNNGGTCTLVTGGFRCSLNTINAYDSAQVYVVIFPMQAGQLQMDLDAVATQTDTYRPDNLVTTVVTASLGSGGTNNPNGVGGNFSGKGGSVDWTWAGLLLLPALRRYARRK